MAEFSWQEVREGLMEVVRAAPERTSMVDRLNDFVLTTPKKKWNLMLNWGESGEVVLRSTLEGLILERSYLLSQVSFINSEGDAVYRYQLGETKNGIAPIRAVFIEDGGRVKRCFNDGSELEDHICSRAITKGKSLAVLVWKAWGDQSGF